MPPGEHREHEERSAGATQCAREGTPATAAIFRRDGLAFRASREHPTEGMGADPALLQRLRQALAGRPEVLEAYLFGSRARRDAAAHSDVDVAVYVAEEPDAPFGYESDLSADLMRAAGTSRVDVVSLERASPLLYHRVLRDGIRLLSRDLRATTGREGRALSRYCDYSLQLAKVDAAASSRFLRGDLGR